MSIKAVVLDYGGVLARSPVLMDFQPVASEIGLSWDVYRDGVAKYRLDYDSDLISCAGMYRRIAADHGLKMSEDQCERLCRADDESWLHPIAETLEWMKELKSANYRVGILTNMASLFFDRHVSAVFAEHIAISDAVVVSGKAGVSKPDGRIYRLMEEELGLDAGSILFFDDNLCNVEGAMAAGWRATLFSTVENAKRFLASCGELTNREKGQ